MPQEWIYALIGGMIIGVAVSVMLVFNGRVTGISGIINGALGAQKGDTLWRVLFIAGLISGGGLLLLLRPELISTSEASTPRLIVAGLLVGFGTLLGSGCTSGHGVCGISRLSIRSIISTLVFMGAGIAIVTLMKSGGLLS